jgi:hypothetical protein
MKRKSLLSIIPLILFCISHVIAGPPFSPLSLPHENIDSRHAQQDTGEEISLTLNITSGMSPYEQVTYEFKSLEGTYVAVLTKRLVRGYEERQGLTLMTREDISTLLDDIDRCDLTLTSDLEETTPINSPYNTAYSLEIHRPAAREYNCAMRMVQNSTEMMLNSPFWCVASTLISTYHHHGDPVLFQGGFFNEGEYGEIYVDSTPSSRIFLDGYDTGLETPVYHLKVAPGLHQIRLVNSLLDIEREYEITVEIDMLTRMVVDLR